MDVSILSESGRPDRYFAQLTPRERQIVRRISLGLPNKQIAYALGISENTVKSYVAEIMAKGRFGNRVLIARWAMMHQRQILAGNNLVEIDLHLDGCACGHPHCIETRAIA